MTDRRWRTVGMKAAAGLLEQTPWLIRRGPARPPRVALTFDDGPDAMTDAYLEALDRLDAPATFFVTGDRLAADRRVVTRYLRGGHQLAAHGWDHTPFPRLTTAELRVQLRRTDAVLGPQPTARPWVRPPHGALTPKVALQLVASGYTVALWSVDPRDYAGPTPEILAQRCSPGRLSGGDVVLLHEGERSTLAALPAIVGRLRDAGFELVTMADLVAR